MSPTSTEDAEDEVSSFEKTLEISKESKPPFSLRDLTSDTMNRERRKGMVGWLVGRSPEAESEHQKILLLIISTVVEGTPQTSNFNMTSVKVEFRRLKTRTELTRKEQILPITCEIALRSGTETF